MEAPIRDILGHRTAMTVSLIVFFVLTETKYLTASLFISKMKAILRFVLFQHN